MGVVEPFDRARRRPTPGQALELAQEARQLADQLGTQAVLLHRVRRNTSAPDSVRSSWNIGGRHGTGGHSDPVGDMVQAEMDAELDGRGPARRAYNETADALLAVVLVMRAAVSAGQAVLEPGVIAGPEDQGCTSHAEHGFLGVPTRTPGSDLCRWCADFWTKYRQRPSHNDLQALEERRVHAEQKRPRAA